MKKKGNYFNIIIIIIIIVIVIIIIIICLLFSFMLHIMFILSPIKFLHKTYKGKHVS